MSKFTGRINRLMLKTHVFISYHDHCLVRDYFKEQFEESEKPEGFDERYKYLVKLRKKFHKSRKAELGKELSEFINNNPPVWYKHMYLMTIEQCKKHPRGILVKKADCEGFMRLLTDVKAYFKRKSKSENDKY